jgi:hypothetical protein
MIFTRDTRSNLAIVTHLLASQRLAFEDEEDSLDMPCFMMPFYSVLV